ncbi:DUF1963 domain-containing protein [Pedobacter psychroterrae]|uniref:DUF1963 domain-containing protein n=1 Tax=Pedobacter psychroterrae TaxID=2530453 RepID=A0A4R0NU43_9SPHI|nr:YwqG family protein [Pedobacter psychroterrae]TCD03493.1 DUF1963 domain-containing protein [Pedobacter psychroterrae]
MENPSLYEQLSRLRTATPELVRKLTGLFVPVTFRRGTLLSVPDHTLPVLYFIEKGVVRGYYFYHQEEYPCWIRRGGFLLPGIGYFLLGQPDVIQNEMELECELVTNGLYCGDPSGYNDPRAEKLRPNAKDWRLLLQIDSNEETEMMWGDVGRLYFWIKEEDLAAKRFENSWCILQCY